jgi:hypothetical protein
MVEQEQVDWWCCAIIVAITCKLRQPCFAGRRHGCRQHPPLICDRWCSLLVALLGQRNPCCTDATVGGHILVVCVANQAG